MNLIRQWIQAATVALVAETRALLVSLGVVSDHRDKRFVGPQTAALIWQPASGQRLVLTSITVACDEAADITLFKGNDIEGNRLVDLPADAALRGIDKMLVPAYGGMAADEGLFLSTNAADGKKTRVVVYGYEEPAN